MEGPIVVVGCGGIGYYLVPPLVRFLEYSGYKGDLFLVDPDRIEPKNLERQYGPKTIGMFKAEALKAHVVNIIDPKNVNVVPVPDAISPKTLKAMKRWFFQSGITLFGCVDNHPSRVLIQEEVVKFKDVLLIMGGNDFETGQVQVYHKDGGKEATPPYTEVHPEMKFVPGRFPDDISCTVAATSEPQLVFANLLVATAMLCAWWTITQGSAEGNETFLKVRGPSIETVTNAVPAK